MSELIKCSLCGKDLSSSAKQCPHCGEPNIICPKCGSKNVAERTIMERRLSMRLFGILSEEYGMMPYKCKECGKKF